MKQRIGIIGGGVSGLTCAYLLQHDYDVYVFEQENRLGGHANTVTIELDQESIDVDTGFIVLNDRNYPLFNRLLNALSVSTLDTEMSFSVKNTYTGIEYNGHNLNTLFAQRKNVFNPSFIRFTLSILKFNRIALSASEQPLNPTKTLADFLQEHDLYDPSLSIDRNLLLNQYLLPMAAAIWSTTAESVLHFPAHFFIQFFKHHGLLELKNRPQWSTIIGGSKTYVQALVKQTQAHFHTDQPVVRVQRSSKPILIETQSSKTHQMDHVIFACHSDQALQLLTSPSELEQAILSELPYAPNRATLHTDASLMPVNRRAWASWNYSLATSADGQPSKPIVTYDMRRLQSIAKTHIGAQPILVSLNADHLIDSNKILRQFDYTHPLFQKNTLDAQNQWQKISGQHNTHYCGAYWFNGFHEDGVRSAMRVAQRFGDYQL